MIEGRFSTWSYTAALAVVGIIAGTRGAGIHSASAPGSTAPPAATARSDAVPPVSPARLDRMGTQLLALSMSDTLSLKLRTPLADTTLAVMVATLPDPIDSHLDWAYDGFLESLRRAHEQTGYAVDRMWLPWLRADSVLDDTPRTRVREAYPGVILFRSPSADTATADMPRYRLLYLVGEVATAGVHPRALYRALAERDVLLGRDSAGLAAVKRPAGWGDTLRVVGPTFSGTSRGLATVLGAWQRQDSRRTVRIATGSATGSDNSRVLAPSTAFTFQSTVHSDALLLNTLRETVLPRLGVGDEQLAILVEGSTAYGQEVGRASEAKRPLRLTFPLNIGTLRDEYAQRPSGRANAGENGEESRVSITLRDPPRPMESPLTASGLTAASVDLVLDQIARTLRTHDIRAVAVAASDVRDRLFLATELRHRLRDVHFIMFEANELYLSPEYNDDLRGMLVVSSYPLTPETQMWERRRQVVPFPSEYAEGVYNAALLQLGDGARMLDYAYPDGGLRSQAPPVWVSAVGSSGLMPMQVRRHTDGYVWPRPWTKLPGAAPEPRMDFVSGVIVLGLALLAVALMLRARQAARVFSQETAADRALLAADRERLNRLPGRAADVCGRVFLFRQAQWGSLRYQEALYRFLFTVALFSGLLPPVVLNVAAALRTRDGGWQSRVAVVLSAAAAAAMTAAMLYSVALLRNWWLEYREHFRTRLNDPDDRRGLWWMNAWARRLVLVLGVVYLVCTLVYVGEVVNTAAGAPVAFTLLVHRALDLGGGMSPLVPLALAAAAFVAWTGWHLRRLAALRTATAFEAACLALRPEVELVDVDAGDDLASLGCPQQWTRMMPPRVVRGVRQVRARLFRLVPHRNAMWLVVVLAVPCGCVILSGYYSLESLSGANTFGALYRFGLVGVVSATGWGVYRLLVVWSGLSRTLRGIAGTPLITSFERLPQRVSRLTRLAVVGVPRSAVVAPVMATQWRHLSTLSRRLAAAAAPAAEASTMPAQVSVPVMFAPPTEPAQARQPEAAVAVLVEDESRWDREPIDGAETETPRSIGDEGGAEPAAAQPDAERAAEAAAERKTREDRETAEGKARAVIEALERVDARAVPADEVEAALHRAAAAYGALPQPAAGLGHWGDAGGGANFLLLARVLEVYWAREPGEKEAGLVARDAEKDAGRPPEGPSTSGRIRRTFSEGLGLWARAAEEYAAVQVVDYVEWTIAQMRLLALFLFTSVLLLVLHESSYPYQPQSLVKLLLFVLLLAAVAAVIKVMVEMNRDDVLSRIARTEPGKLTWDRHFILNALVFGLVPLSTLIGSEFPVVRSILFAWIYPITRMLGGGG
ncbi:MAG TPA: hypothetical protein VEX86_24340 [Longimicrobium sp.]|nr:hypothetical protein [Longimicrobium sp.]